VLPYFNLKQKKPNLQLQDCYLIQKNTKITVLPDCNFNKKILQWCQILILSKKNTVLPDGNLK